MYSFWRPDLKTTNLLLVGTKIEGRTSLATARSSTPLAATRGNPRSRQRHRYPAPLQEAVPVRSPATVFPPAMGSMTHPQKPPQRAQCPDTRGSDRDHHPAPGNDRTQKRTGGRASFKRRVFKKTFHPWSSFRESFALLACWSVQGRWSQQHNRG